MTDEAKKCELREGAFVEPCFGLRSAVEGPLMSIRKGIGSVRLMNLHTKKISKYYYAIKTTDNQKGLVLNFCPFCGGEILPAEYKSQMIEEVA